MDNKSFRQRVIDLEVGQSITVPIEEVGYTTIRSYASDLSFAYKRRYTSRRNRNERTYTLTRIQ